MNKSRFPWSLGLILLVVGSVGACLCGWKLLVDLGPASITSAAGTLADVALTKPQELMVLIQAGQSVYVGFAALVTVALGYFLVKVAPVARRSTVGVPARAVESEMAG